jgi:predicted Zn-dependent protease with MMP-like domain
MGFSGARDQSIVTSASGIDKPGIARPVDKPRRAWQHERRKGWISTAERNMKRMSLKKFCRVVARVMETLPAEFVPYLDNVVVDVEEEPDEATLRKAGLTDEEIEAGESLFGLFDPLELPSLYAGDAVDTQDMLHRLIIFKRPLEEEFPDRQQLLIEIRKTVIHELAHHFGFTDRDLERFDDNPDPFGEESEPDEPG